MNKFKTSRAERLFLLLNRFAFLVFTAIILLSPNLAQASEAIPANLTQEEQADIKRVEAHLNAMKTLRAGFLQVSSNGGVATGKLYLSRPGKLRFEYDPPAPILMVADGTFLIYIDKELEQITHLWLSNTPIGFLVEKNIKMAGDVTVTKFSKARNVLNITLARSDEPEQGSIKMIFADSPLSLRKWVVVDAQGIETSVTLSNLETGIGIDPKLFTYSDFNKDP